MRVRRDSPQQIRDTDYVGKAVARIRPVASDSFYPRMSDEKPRVRLS